VLPSCKGAVHCDSARASSRRRRRERDAVLMRKVTVAAELQGRRPETNVLPGSPGGEGG
jgi:hypothetical protein